MLRALLTDPPSTSRLHHQNLRRRHPPRQRTLLGRAHRVPHRHRIRSARLRENRRTSHGRSFRYYRRRHRDDETDAQCRFLLPFDQSQKAGAFKGGVGAYDAGCGRVSAAACIGGVGLLGMYIHLMVWFLLALWRRWYVVYEGAVVRKKGGKKGRLTGENDWLIFWCVDVVCRRQRNAPDHNGRDTVFAARSPDAGAAVWTVENTCWGE